MVKGILFHSYHFLLESNIVFYGFFNERKEILSTVLCIILYTPLIFLEIMVIIKVESHPCYPINLWLIWIGIKQKFFFFLKKKIQNGRLKKMTFFKIANSQYFFLKILWIRRWVSRIDCCKGHRCGSTYMAVRLSDICSKMA